MFVELVEAAFPVRPLPIEPRLDPFERTWDQVVRPYASHLARSHETAVLEDAEVLREGGQGHREGLCQGRDGRRPPPQPFDHGPARRVGEPTEDLVECGRLLVRH